MKLGMKTNFKTTKQGKFTSIESLKYQANEGVLHYGLTDKSRKKENKATMVQSIQVTPKQPVHRLCHNVYIRIKTPALLFNGSEPN